MCLRPHEPVWYQEMPASGCTGGEARGFSARYPLVISAKWSDQWIKDQANIDPGRVAQRLP